MIEWKRDVLCRLNDALSVVGTPHWLILSDAAREIRRLRKLLLATVKGGTMKNDQAFSEGARYERKAARARLRRRIRHYNDYAIFAAKEAVEIELDWVLA